jgi:malonyl-CoA O-methyltransferase
MPIDPKTPTPARRIDLPTREGYDLWSAVYDSDGNPLIAIEEPLVDQLVGDFRGLRVLDAGCGTGRHAFRLAAGGAIVDAVDFSGGMLAQAKQKPGSERIRFHVHDLATMFPFPDHSFDRVICGLLLDHVENPRGFFAESGRVCSASGLIVVSVMHPALMLKGVQARFHDSATGNEIRPASQSHQVSDYVMAALDSGLIITHLSEHCATEMLAAKHPRAQRYIGWPMLLMMALKRAA